ncbi:cyclic nucleotide-binding/CBS domain-containing protein [Planctomycetota bacterium]
MNCKKLTVKDLMSSYLYTVNPKEMLTDVCAHMSGRNIGLALIMEDGRLIGVFSERDLLHLIGTLGSDLESIRVSAVMTTEIDTISEDARLEDGIRHMLEQHRRHLIVTRDGDPVGVFSLRSAKLLELINPLQPTQ